MCARAEADKGESSKLSAMAKETEIKRALIVNGEEIDEGMIREEIARMKPRYVSMFKHQTAEQQNGQLLEWAKENLIERTLLRQAAARYIRRIPAEKLEARFREFVKKNADEESLARALEASGLSQDQVKADLELQMRMDELVQSIRDSVAPPSNDEIVQYYQQNKEEFMMPEVIRAGHIVIYVGPSRSHHEAIALIQEVYRKLQQGVPFEELAGQYSDCPANDGDLGYFGRGEMVEEFEEAVFALTENQTSGVIQSPFGYHVAKLYDRKPARLRPIVQIRDEVATRLHQEKKQKAVEDYVDKLRETALVVGM